MTHLKRRNISVLILLVTVSYIFSFQSCSPDDSEEDERTTCDTCVMVYKPNIYIYPEQEIQLLVSLAFPKGGSVMLSIPEYNDGWNITVDTLGMIDKTYTYLFYESQQPDVWQMKEGWCIKQENLQAFFEDNLSKYGFGEREITDFTAYWIPRFQSSLYYSVFPQTDSLINSVIELSFSEKPENILRLFYVVIESDIDTSGRLTEPFIAPFKRENYFVSEWGVILK